MAVEAHRICAQCLQATTKYRTGCGRKFGPRAGSAFRRHGLQQGVRSLPPPDERKRPQITPRVSTHAAVAVAGSYALSGATCASARLVAHHSPPFDVGAFAGTLAPLGSDPAHRQPG
eukprot:scaffold3700_cov387-Prasinococcus_capsulatus_cf.AAC.1